VNLNLRARRALLGLMTAALPLAGIAAEGMWTLDNLPLAQMKSRYGFAPDTAWVDKLMRASVRLAGGCSASFVSADGLVMTNHHCIARCVQQLSGPGNDRMANGFLARGREQELRCPDTELNRLETITDVTTQVRAATAGKQGAAFAAAEDAVRAALTRECRGADAETTRCDLVALYRGGQYQLYKYHRYSDVRLVWAPEEPIAAFGGDPDNFSFPRYDLDVGFLRAYEGGKPAPARDFFRFKPAGAEAGELVFVAGNPGQTQRQLTVAQLETLRDELALRGLPGLSELRGLLLQYARGDAEARRLAMGALAGIENGLKVQQGRLLALLDPALLDIKRRNERALQEFVAARPELKAQVGDPWADIARAQVARRNLDLEYTQIEEGRALSSGYFQFARTLVRGAAERAKPSGQRLREFSETSMPQIEARLRSPAPLYPAFEQARLAWSLNRLRSLLGPDSAVVRQVLGTRSPEQVAESLVSSTKLGDPAERQRLWAGGAAAIEASDDPFIQLARALDPTARMLRSRFETEVLAVEREAAQRLAVASFAQTGKSAYPDATFSLRVSYGDIQGWVEKGRPVPPFTDFAGLYARATGAPPFALPASWLEARPKLNPAQRMNFVATLDTIGGNSGSPILNRQLEVVGLLFDGNQASLGDAYYYDETLNRSVGVHPGAIVEALRTVYSADDLLAELLGGSAR
jgi:hypothetical protein